MSGERLQDHWSSGFDNEVGIIGNALFFLRMLSMCKHVYIAQFGIRFAQLVICMTEITH